MIVNILRGEKMNEQINMFDILYDSFKIDKPIRLIELFAGYGSQSFALKYLGVPFEHHKICEWAVPSIQAYKDAHCTNDNNDYSKDLTKEEVINYLFNKGISMDYNQPMKLEQIKRLGENQIRTIYNNIIATNNLVNVQQAKGKDLDIVDNDKYCYVLVYSFPCQDLSLSGLKKGMSRDGGTRSGMLWEVERILDECNELGTLPNVLLMENVPQVIGCNAISDFQEWRAKLESLGYSNYVEILNAKDYGIPQNRERCFMVSILGDYNYNFPKKIPLEKKLKNLLEDNVDEKYYLSDKMIQGMINTNFESYKLENKLLDENGCANTIIARFEGTPQCIQIKNATKKGYLDAYEGDGVDISGRMQYHRGTVQRGMAQTLKTTNDVGVVVKDDSPLKRELCNKLIANGECEEGDVIKHSYTQQILDGKKKCVEKSDGIMITLTTRGDCVGVCVKDEYVGTYNFSAPTLLTQPKEGIVLKKNTPNYIEWEQKGRLDIDCRAWKENAVAPTTTTTPNTKVLLENPLRIRKLTPKECFRLMGVKDEDFENIAKKQSNSKLYHLAGDSIPVNLLMALFDQMIGKGWENIWSTLINKNK